MSRSTIGIDPGLKGAIAVLDHNGLVRAIHDMPTSIVTVGRGNFKSRRNQVDGEALATLLREYVGARAVVEKVRSRPGEGHVGAFSFGRTLGVIEGVLSALAVPTTLVEPATWKQALRCPADKDQARARASELLPGGACHWPRKKDDGRAEAALLAYYGAMVHGKAQAIEW